MIKLMSLTARRELLESIRQKYREASWVNKGKILDGFVAATDYDRKYATRLLNSSEVPAPAPRRPAAHQYDEQVRQALLAVWYAANQICSKRLVPFLPQLVTAMEQYGHLRLPTEVRQRLLSISPATVDHMLRPERESQTRYQHHTSRQPVKTSDPNKDIRRLGRRYARLYGSGSGSSRWRKH
jgi:hypothetical protein